EGRVLGEEAPAGVNGLAAGGGRRRDQRRDAEIALGRLRRPDADGPVREPHVERVVVGGRVDGDGLDVQLVQRANDAHGDLASIRDENALEHAQTASSGGTDETGSSSNSSWPNSTGSALRTWIASTIPAASVLISFMSFIASRMQSVCPGATVSPSSTKGGAPGCGAR